MTGAALPPEILLQFLAVPPALCQTLSALDAIAWHRAFSASAPSKRLQSSARVYRLAWRLVYLCDPRCDQVGSSTTEAPLMRYTLLCEREVVPRSARVAQLCCPPDEMGAWAGEAAASLWKPMMTEG